MKTKINVSKFYEFFINIFQDLTIARHKNLNSYNPIYTNVQTDIDSNIYIYIFFLLF